MNRIRKGEIHTKLVICGNGLDLHVGFKTGYRNYRDYLANDRLTHGGRAIPIIEESVFFKTRKGDCWSDLEQSLTFDGKKYIDALVYAYDRDIDPNSADNSHNQIKAANEVQKKDPKDIAFQFTNDWFYEWLLNEYYGREEEVRNNYHGIVRDITSCPDNLYITFNYTPTLESIFGVDEDHILYIHNRFPYKPKLPFSSDDLLNDIFESGEKRFQFGSINNQIDEWIKYLKSIELKSNGKLMQLSQVEKDLQHIGWAFSKNLKCNYATMKSFLKEALIDEIVIIGHSFLGVDEQYYRDILVPMYKYKKWTFYYYQSDEMARNFIDKYGINEFDLVAI